MTAGPQPTSSVLHLPYFRICLAFTAKSSQLLVSLDGLRGWDDTFLPASQNLRPEPKTLLSSFPVNAELLECAWTYQPRHYLPPVLDHVKGL